MFKCRRQQIWGVTGQFLMFTPSQDTLTVWYDIPSKVRWNYPAVTMVTSGFNYYEDKVREGFIRLCFGTVSEATCSACRINWYHNRIKNCLSESVNCFSLKCKRKWNFGDMMNDTIVIRIMSHGIRMWLRIPVYIVRVLCLSWEADMIYDTSIIRILLVSWDTDKISDTSIIGHLSGIIWYWYN